MKRTFLAAYLLTSSSVRAAKQRPPSALEAQYDASSLYRKVQAVNTSECLEKVRSLPLRLYEFAYDTVKGRRQLGVIGSSLESILPESVDVVKSQAFKNPETAPGSPALVKLANFPVVDKNVLFMYNVGATQHLIERQAQLDELVAQLEALERRANYSLSTLEGRIDGEVEAQQVEAAAKAQALAASVRAEAFAAEAKLREERLLLDKQAETERATVDFEAKLHEQRLAAEDSRERERSSEVSRLREEVSRRSEEQRRATELLLKEKQLEQDQVLEAERRSAELERVSAEASAKAEAERLNEDVSLRQIAAKGLEERRRTLEAITTVFSHLGSGFTALLGNPRQLATLLGSVLLVVAGGFLAREGATLVRQLLEAKLGRPRLVRETSRAARGLLAGLLLAPFDLVWLLLRFVLWLLAFAAGPRTWATRVNALVGWGRGKDFGAAAAAAGAEEAGKESEALEARKRRAEEVTAHFSQVVLPGPLLERVQQLAVATRNAKRNQVPYRHLLLYGPPGTGKTMVAQRLAKASGMDYALMSGGDVGPLGKDAVTELHALFRWAKGSSSGLLLFIDEAEAFLGSRSRSAMSEALRNALNALLYQTGTQSYSFMMVLATNRAEDLDSAVLDRMDESLYFGLPNPFLRISLVRQYFDAYVTSHTSKARRAKERKKAWLSVNSWRRCVRAVLGQDSSLADLGLPPPLVVRFLEHAEEVGGTGLEEPSSSSSSSSNGKAKSKSGAGNARAEKKAPSRGGSSGPAETRSDVAAGLVASAAVKRASEARSKASAAKAALTRTASKEAKSEVVLFEEAAGAAEAEAAAAEEACKVSCLTTVAEKLEGFSGREISKLMVAMQSVAFGSAENALSPPTLRRVVDLKIDEHRRKMLMVNSTHSSPTRAAAHHSPEKIQAPSSPMRSPNNSNTAPRQVISNTGTGGL